MVNLYTIKIALIKIPSLVSHTDRGISKLLFKLVSCRKVANNKCFAQSMVIPFWLVRIIVFQRADIPTYVRTAHNGLLQKTLEKESLLKCP